MRFEITDEGLNDAFRAAQGHMCDVLNRKGRGSYASTHEVLGVLTDERSELVQAIQQKRGLAAIRHELLDEIVAALFAVACIDAGTVEW